MVDFLSPAERSERMARIRGTDTKPELKLRRLLHARGLRYRLHVPNLPGRPDLVFPRHRVVVFVHGCFWHRHFECKIANTPKSNAEYWNEKFKRNQARDAQNKKLLESAGWNVLVVWECELATQRLAEATAARVQQRIVDSKAAPGSPAALQPA